MPGKLTRARSCCTRVDFSRCRARCSLALLSRGGEFGMLDVVVPGELCQSAHRQRWCQVCQMQLLLGIPNIRIGVFQCSQKKTIIAGAASVHQPLVELAALRLRSMRAPPSPCCENSSWAARRLACWERSASRERGSTAFGGAGNSGLWRGLGFNVTSG